MEHQLGKLWYLLVGLFTILLFHFPLWRTGNLVRGISQGYYILKVGIGLLD